MRAVTLREEKEDSNKLANNLLRLFPLERKGKIIFTSLAKQNLENTHLEVRLGWGYQCLNYH